MEAILQVSENLEAIEVMTYNHMDLDGWMEIDILTFLLTLVSVVGSGRVSTFFACTEPQESNSDIGLRNGTRHCALGPILRPEFQTLLSVVQSECVLPFFASTESQESKSGSCDRMQQCAL